MHIRSTNDYIEKKSFGENRHIYFLTKTRKSLY